MKDFSRVAKYLNLIRHQFPRVLRQGKKKLEGRGNSWTYPSINVTHLRSATKSHQFEPRVLLGGLVAHVCRNLVYISVEESLQFKGLDSNHPVSDRSGHNLRLL